MRAIGKIVAALILGTLGYFIFGMIAGMASGATASPSPAWVLGVDRAMDNFSHRNRHHRRRSRAR